MKLYCGIDLHSNNSYIVIIDENDKIVAEKKVVNDLKAILALLLPFRDSICGVAVESTFNWYWLVDGLIENDFSVHLVNTSKVKQYEGLKYSDDKYDSFWLAHLMRLEILPTGYIYPKEERAIRDLVRRRMQLVQQKTTHILSIQNQIIRNTGIQVSANDVRKLNAQDIEGFLSDVNQRLAINSNLCIMHALEKEVHHLEQAAVKQVMLREEYKLLLDISGIGKILALTIMLETGDISRFKHVGNYASYCRCVNSKLMSNDKKKGKGNTKNGNKYLAWAYIEAANFAIRFNENAKRYYQKKAAKTKRVIALKAVAHKLSRACYYVIKNQEPFNNDRIFI